MKLKFHYFIYFLSFLTTNQYLIVDEINSLDVSNSKEVCEKFSKKIYDYYSNGNGYKIKDNEIQNVSSKYFDDLFRIINFHSSSGKYNKHLAKHYFFIYFGIFIILIWIAYNIFLNFKIYPHLEVEKDYLKYILLIFINILYLTIFILSLIGAVHSGKIKNNLDEIKCNFYLFNEQYKKGNYDDSYYKDNYWSGAENIINKLNYIKEIYYNIYSITKTVDFKLFENFNNTIDEFLNNVDSSLFEYNFTIEDYKNENDTNISIITLFPEYSYEWENYLNSLYITLNDIINLDIEKMIENIFDYYLNINNTINYTYYILNENSKIIDRLYISTFEPWLKFQDEKYDKNIMVFILFIFICIFCFLIISLEIFRFFLKFRDYIFKIIFHVIWNLLNFLLISIFIFGGYYGIYGTIAKDYSVVINEIFSQENLNNKYNKIHNKYDNLSIFYNFLYGNYYFNFSEILNNVKDANSYYQNLNSYLEKFNHLHKNISNMNNLIIFYYKNIFYLTDHSETYNLSKRIEYINNFTIYYNISEEGNCYSWINETWTNETFLNNENSNNWHYKTMENKLNNNFYNECNNSNNSISENISCNINLYKINKYNIPERYKEYDDGDICENLYKNINFNSTYESSKHYKKIFDQINQKTILTDIKDKQKKISLDFEQISNNLNSSFYYLYNNISSLCNDYRNIILNISGYATNHTYLKKNIKIIIENLNNGYGNRYIKIEKFLVSIGFILLITQILSIFLINNILIITYYDKNK